MHPAQQLLMITFIFHCAKLIKTVNQRQISFFSYSIRRGEEEESGEEASTKRTSQTQTSEEGRSLLWERNWKHSGEFGWLLHITISDIDAPIFCADRLFPPKIWQITDSFHRIQQNTDSLPGMRMDFFESSLFMQIILKWRLSCSLLQILSYITEAPLHVKNEAYLVNNFTWLLPCKLIFRWKEKGKCCLIKKDFQALSVLIFLWELGMFSLFITFVFVILFHNFIIFFHGFLFKWTNFFSTVYIKRKW